MVKKEDRKAIQGIYRYQASIFKFFGCLKWPNEASLWSQRIYEIYYYHLLIFWILLLDALICISIANVITVIDELIQIFLLFASLVSFLTKYLTIRQKREKFVVLLDLLHSKAFGVKNLREEKLLKSALKLISNIRYSYSAMSVSALMGVMLTKTSDGSVDLPIQIPLPYNLTNALAFFLTFLYEFIAVGIGCVTNIAFDSLCPSLLVFVKVQLEILGDRLKNVSEMTNGDNEKVQMELVAAMKFYENIVQLFRKIEELISFPMSIQVLCSILVLVANFYSLVVLSESKIYLNLIGIGIYHCCMLMQIFMICFFANEVMLYSLKISHRLYSTDWMFWDKKNRKLALLMMSCYDVPLRLKTINRNYSFNLAAFTSIVNSSYSYFALLKRLKE